MKRDFSFTDNDQNGVVVHSMNELYPAFQTCGIDNKSDMRRRIYLIEANSGLRARVARAIFADGLHAEIFSSIGEFLEFSPTESGIIVVNDNLDGEGGACIVERLNQARLHMPIIVYSEHATIAKAIDVIRAGAENFISLSEFNARLRSAVEKISSDVETRHIRQVQVNDLERRISFLTNREKQVLEFLVSGLSNKEIAKELGISPRTVEIHRMKMLSKLAARTSVDAVRIWCSVTSGVYIHPIAQSRY